MFIIRQNASNSSLPSILRDSRQICEPEAAEDRIFGSLRELEKSFVVYSNERNQTYSTRKWRLGLFVFPFDVFRDHNIFIPAGFLLPFYKEG